MSIAFKRINKIKQIKIESATEEEGYNYFILTNKETGHIILGFYYFK